MPSDNVCRFCFHSVKEEEVLDDYKVQIILRLGSDYQHFLAFKKALTEFEDADIENQDITQRLQRIQGGQGVLS